MNAYMVKDLLVNAAFLISFVHISAHLVRNTGFDINSPRLDRVGRGFFFGVLGCILMVYGIRATPSIIVDLRLVPIVLAAVDGGLAASITAALVIALFRVAYFGVSSVSTIAFTVSLVHGVVSGICAVKFKEPKSFILATLGCVSVSGIAIFICLHNQEQKMISSFLFIPFALTSSYVVYLLRCNLREANQLYRRYKDDATRDYLTGLLNVRSFDVSVNSVLSEMGTIKAPLSLLAIDVDHFKQINDLYGHVEGDAVLRQLATVLNNCCRSQEVFRTGGEEFFVILKGCDYEQSRAIAERIRRTVEVYDFVLSDGRGDVKVTVSVGVATYTELMSGMSELKKMADRALYTAKNSGRNAVA